MGRGERGEQKGGKRTKKGRGDQEDFRMKHTVLYIERGEKIEEWVRGALVGKEGRGRSKG